MVFCWISSGGFRRTAIQEFKWWRCFLNPSVSGGASEEAWQSIFCQSEYNFQEKYFLKANVEETAHPIWPSLAMDISSFCAWNGYRQRGIIEYIGPWLGTDATTFAEHSRRSRIGINLRANLTYRTLITSWGKMSIVPAVAINSTVESFINWETIEQYDIGIDRFRLSNKLVWRQDYFNRTSLTFLHAIFLIPEYYWCNNLAAQNAWQNGK